MAMDVVNSVETVEDFGNDDPESTVRRWVAEINAASKNMKDWHSTSKDIIERYRNEDKNSANSSSNRKHSRFNILWSNVKTLQPLLYSATPKPEVQRRFKDSDIEARLASEILERALDVCIDSYDFDSPMKMVRDDYLLTGRGQAWIRYIPTFGEMESVEETGEEYRPVVDEKVICEYVPWSDFYHSPAPSWDQVTWVARRTMMTRKQLKVRFGDEIGNKIPLSKSTKDISDQMLEEWGDVFKRAEIWEIWNKTDREVIWICTDYKEGWLDRKVDPLNLYDFFPCPEPLYSNKTTGSLVPVPDYVQWQTQARELDSLTERISLLTEALRVTGAYNSNISDTIQDLLSSNLENRLVPVDEWAVFAEGGGFKGSIAFLPIAEIAQVLQGLYESRRQIKNDLYEITGLADIIRGASHKDETATAQRIKSRFASVRLEDRQMEVSKFVRNVLRIKAEIISEHFSPESLANISNWAQMDPAKGFNDPDLLLNSVLLIKDDKMRTFRVDIETDGTISPDREIEKQTRIEFLSNVTPFLEKAIPAIQTFPDIGPLMGHMLLFAIKGFDTGRNLEGAFEEAIESIGKMQPPADPAEAQNNAELELKKMKIEAEISKDQQMLEIERNKLQMEGMRLQLEQMKVEQSGGAEQQRALGYIQEIQASIEDKRNELILKERELEIRKANVDNQYELGLLQIQSKDKESTFNADVKREELAIRSRDQSDKMQFERDSNETVANVEGMRNIVDNLINLQNKNQESMARQMERMYLSMQELAKSINAPKKVLRDQEGKIIGTAPMDRMEEEYEMEN